jgi:hypothetical protein
VKLLRTMLLSLMTITMLISSRPSHALIGAAFANTPVVIGGLVIAGAGAGVYGAAYYVTTQSNDHRAIKIILMMLATVVSAAIVAVGVVVLEDGNSISYVSLSPADAHKIGLSQSELQSYINDLEEINALTTHVSSELASISNPTIEESAAVWTSVKEAVSADTFSALVKVTAQLYK